ncbi:hypothetical protein SUGI_1036810 [Cryptomeria japonica]|nr:hypothetical protein SUGI_1036810 [Cryptomeria japonica]
MMRETTPFFSISFSEEDSLIHVGKLYSKNLRQIFAILYIAHFKCRTFRAFHDKRTSFLRRLPSTFECLGLSLPYEICFHLRF